MRTGIGAGRCGFFPLAGIALSILAMSIASPAACETHEIRAVMSRDGAAVYFDPVGLRIQPDDTV
ncbi:MAG: hypothetical protein ACLGHY_12085, partial [Gammaproteobacteria bacterium]